MIYAESLISERAYNRKLKHGSKKAIRISTLLRGYNNNNNYRSVSICSIALYRIHTKEKNNKLKTYIE